MPVTCTSSAIVRCPANPAAPPSVQRLPMAVGRATTIDTQLDGNWRRLGDGRQVWLYDADLNQVTVRPMSEALGATPAALLAGTALERDFELKAEPSAQGLEWVQAQPKKKDGSFQALRVGFAGRQLAALEIVDSFGQRSLLRFADLRTNAAPSAQAFEFTPPKGAEVLR